MYLASKKALPISSNLTEGAFEIDGFSILLECSQWKISCNYIMTSWRRKWQPNPVLLPGKSHGRRSLAGCSPWGRKESDTTEWLHRLSLHRDCHLADIVVWHIDCILFSQMDANFRGKNEEEKKECTLKLLKRYICIKHISGFFLHKIFILDPQIMTLVLKNMAWFIKPQWLHNVDEMSLLYKGGDSCQNSLTEAVLIACCCCC